MEKKKSELRRLLRVIDRKNISVTEVIDLIENQKKEGANFSEKFNLIIDYSRSLKEMILAGSYDWSDSDVLKENFIPKGLVGKKVDVDAKIFYFNKTVKNRDIFIAMEKEGYRPANLFELLALGEAKPDLQKKFGIFALHPIWSCVPDVSRVPALRFASGQRRLFLYWFTTNWSRHHRFLAVRE